MVIPSITLAAALVASAPAHISHSDLSAVCTDRETITVLRDMARNVSLEEEARIDKLCLDNLRGRR